MVKGDFVHFARTSTCEVCLLQIRNVGEDWFVGYDEKTQQSFPFREEDVGKVIFQTNEDAKNFLKKRGI